MKSSQTARSKSMEIDRRVRALAWTGEILKLLLVIATARVENSEAKILRGLRRHCLQDQRPEQFIHPDCAAVPLFSEASHPRLLDRVV